MVYDAFQTFGRSYKNGDDYIEEVHKCCTPVNKAMSEISYCCHYFLSNPCINKEPGGSLPSLHNPAIGPYLQQDLPSLQHRDLPPSNQVQ